MGYSIGLSFLRAYALPGAALYGKNLSASLGVVVLLQPEVLFDAESRRAYSSAAAGRVEGRLDGSTNSRRARIATRSGFLVNTERVMIPSIDAGNRDEIIRRCGAKAAHEVGSTANRGDER
jgi:hypothetical protein